MDLHAALRAVDERMRDVASSEVDVLRDASRHILLAGGKRIRPRLLFLAYQAVGGDDLESVLAPAAALEILHTATLAHDDINDHGVLRRNRPTINAIWGRTFALLTGDFLFAKVYEMLAPYGRVLNAILAQAAVGVVEGETLQAQAAKTGLLDEATYYRIISLKTAPLFQAAAKVGAILGAGTPAQTSTLADFGFNIGLSFQIIDDILDLMADSKQLGKTAGLDLSQGKGVAVAVGGGDGGDGGDSSDGRSAVAVDVAVDVATGVDKRDPLLAFKRSIFQGDTIERARRQAHDLAARAVEGLGALPLSPAVEALKALAWSTVERDR